MRQLQGADEQPKVSVCFLFKKRVSGVNKSVTKRSKAELVSVINFELNLKSTFIFVVIALVIIEKHMLWSIPLSTKKCYQSLEEHFLKETYRCEVFAD